MHDYPPLLSGALQLLFKHFSQRAEVLQAFKQVRLEGPQYIQGKSSESVNNIQPDFMAAGVVTLCGFSWRHFQFLNRDMALSMPGRDLFRRHSPQVIF